ncbi:MAG: GNAT family N-acetyltransferase [Ignavibacteria bacterium]|nr:GNAT family N-acetyltransferase [Ignavibacteria bacterium]
MSQSIIFSGKIEEIGKGFRLDKLSDEYTIKIWTPSLSRFVPQSYPKKYFLYWIFHFFRIFRNNNYSSVLIYHKGKVVSCILAIPAYFKWPFMGKYDVQIAYVITDTNYRGKGLAAAAILESVKNLLNKNVQNIWYVTSVDNTSSIKLCTKLGFQKIGYGARKYFLKFLHILQLSPA